MEPCSKWKRRVLSAQGWRALFLKSSCPSDAKSVMENENFFLQSLIRCYIKAGILKPSDGPERSYLHFPPFHGPVQRRKAASQPNVLQPLPSHPQGSCSASQPVPPALPFAAGSASSHRCIFSLVQERLHQDLNFGTAAGCTTDSFCSVFLNCLFYAPTRFSFFSLFFPNECCFLPFLICRSHHCGLC